MKLQIRICWQEFCLLLIISLCISVYSPNWSSEHLQPLLVTRYAAPGFKSQYMLFWLPHFGMLFGVCIWLGWLGLILGRLGFPWQAPQSAASPFIYPGMCLLFGLSLLLLTDYSVYGLPELRFEALNQAFGVAIAVFVFVFTAALKPTLMANMARFMSHIDSSKRSYHFIVALLFVLLLIVLAARIEGWMSIEKKYRIVKVYHTFELFRCVLCVGLAWIAYRWVQGGSRVGHWMRGLVVLSLLVVFTSVGVKYSNDNGPILIFGCAAITLASALIATRLTNHDLLRTIVGTTLAIGLLCAVMALVFNFASEHSSTLADRIEAIVNPFASKEDFLSLLKWFISITPIWGYGQGEVAWCGSWHSVIASFCNALPKQAVNDYTFAMVIGLWGAVAAWLLCMLTLAWLLLLAYTAIDSAASNRMIHISNWVQWILLCFVFLTTSQLILSVLGTLGVTPMTGIPLPLWSVGTSDFLVTAFFAALAVNRETIQKDTK